MNEVIDRLQLWLKNNGHLIGYNDVRKLIEEFKFLQESHNRMTEIYTRRGETIAEMRRLLDQTS